MMNKKRLILVILLIPLVLAASIYAGFKVRQLCEERRLLNERKEAWLNLRKVLEDDIAAFRGQAGVVIEDLSNNWKLVHNKDKAFASASVAKIPIMAACFKAADQGELNLQEVVVLQDHQKVNGSGELRNMPAGSEFTVGELIELSIADSDNTATNILIDLLGFDYINDFLKELGLKGTNLSRKMMDFRLRANGIENFTTAEDTAYILEKIYKQEMLNEDVSGECLRLLKKQKINDRIPAKLPEDTEVAHKTGLENGVCHDVGIIFNQNCDLLICVLTETKGAKDSRKAKEFISQIALDAYNYCRELEKILR